MRVYGFLEKAQLENTASDLSNTLLGLIWYNTTDNKAKIYNGSVDSVVTEAATQTLTNKTFSGGTITGAALSGGTISGVDINLGTASDSNKLVVSQDTRSNLELLTREAGSFYYSTDEAKYLGDDGLNLVEIGSGSGEGINYTLNPDAETNANDHDVYKDSASAVPDDAIGGSPTLAVSRSTVAPLLDNASFVLAKPASNVQGEGVKIASRDFDDAYKGRLVSIRFEYDASDTNAQDGDFRLFFKDETNGDIIRVDNEDIFAKKGLHTAYVQVPSNCDNGSIVIHCAATHSDAYNFKYDKVSIGPVNTTSSGSFITDAETLSGVTVNWTNTTVTAKYRMVGGFAEIEVDLDITGTPVGGALEVTSLGGLSIDTSQLNNAATNLSSSFGAGEAFDLSTSSSYSLLASAINNTGNIILRNTAGGTGQANLTPTAPFAFAAGDKIFFKVSVPILGRETGLRASEVVSGRRILTDAFLTVGSHSGSGDEVVIFNNVVSDTSGSYNNSNGIWTCPESDVYTIGSHLIVTSGSFNFVNIRIDDGVSPRFFDIQNSSTIADGSVSLYIKKGTQVSILANATVASNYQTSGNACYFNIVRQNSLDSQGVPFKSIAMSAQSSNGQSIPHADAANGRIEYEIVDFDNTNSYNPTTGQFTVPVSGKYFISATFRTGISLTSSLGVVTFWINGVQTRDGNVNQTSNDVISAQGSCLLNLSKGDIVEVRAFQSNNLSTAQNLNVSPVVNHFNIARVGI